MKETVSRSRSAGSSRRKRLIVGISGATGAVYGVRLLETLAAQRGWEAHLVLTDAGVLNTFQELGLSRKAVEELAKVHYHPKDIGAAIASGSFLTEGMVIAPCSMKTLAAVAHGFGDNLLTRAADVMLKERRPLLLMVRETPFNLAHLRNMCAVTEMGGIVFPPLPAFYHRPASIDEMVADTVERVLQMLRLPGAEPQRWQGLKPA